MKVHDDDWVFLNRIKKGKTMKPGPIWHETILGRRVQPVARKLGLPHHLASPEALGSHQYDSGKDGAAGGAAACWALAGLPFCWSTTPRFFQLWPTTRQRQ
jgi:hypothetical protein